MSSSHLAGLVIGLGAGLLGGIMGASLLGGEQTPALSVESGADLGALDQRIVDLASAVDGIATRLADLELRPRASDRTALQDGAGGEAVAASGGSSFNSSPEVMSVLASQQFQDQVGAILADIEDREQRERDQRRDDAEADRLEERLVELTERLGLYGNQVNSMRTILSDERLARSEAIAKAREIGDWGSMRTSMREVRDTSNAALAEVLSVDQMAKYTDYQNSQGFGGMFGGRSGGRGNQDGGSGGSGDRGGR
ncbi:MAG: hypothetical protein QF411_14300 [Planctomycetota bacterium]|nr:hypothetical protein [Planctomycetota bacterium]